jgi:hypothetical protein
MFVPVTVTHSDADQAVLSLHQQAIEESSRL